MNQSICSIMSEAYKRGWITSRDGNISYYSPTLGCIQMTPSGVLKHRMQYDDIIDLEIESGTLILGDKNPSGEFYMHWLIHGNYLQERAVVHLHPTYTIASMLRGFQLDVLCKEFPELSRYTRVGPTVPIIEPVSIELAEATISAFSPDEKGILSCDIVGQRGHGVCAVGTDPWDAFEHIERLEHICEIVLASGIKPFDIQ